MPILTLLDYIVIYSGIGAALGIALVIFASWHFRRNPKMCKALDHLESNIAHGHGSPIVALAMLANGLTRNDRAWAIHCLVALATLNNNSEAFLALRDHIRPKDLRHMLKSFAGGDLRNRVQGGAIGQTNSKKLICFAIGTRTLEHLDSDLTAVEHRMLRDRFQIHQPLELVDTAVS